MQTPIALSIEACSGKPQFCVGSEQEEACFDVQGMTLVQGFIPHLDRLLKQRGCSLEELQHLSVTTGPGPFTATRVAVTSMKGLSWALGKPLYACTALEVLAEAFLCREPASPCVVLIDAGRQEYYGQIWKDLKSLNEHQPLLLSQAAWQECINPKTVVVGYPGQNLSQTFSSYRVVEIAHAATTLHQMSFRLFDQNVFTDRRLVQPYYLREPDAVKSTLNQPY